MSQRRFSDYGGFAMIKSKFILYMIAIFYCERKGNFNVKIKMDKVQIHVPVK